jgi:serine protease Do
MKKSTGIKYFVFSVTILALILGIGCGYFSVLAFSSISSGTIDYLPSPRSTDNSAMVPPTRVSSLEAAVIPSVVIIGGELISYDRFGHPIAQPISGSGWIFDGNGLIITNSHVVAGAQNVVVTLNNGLTYSAKTIREDSIHDLAVIDIAVGNLQDVPWGDSSKMKVGDYILASGNTWGEGIKTTRGTIVATGVAFEVDTRETLYDMIGINAPINYGNSGGPLFNMRGEVIGIVTAATFNLGVEFYGYAISTNIARPTIMDLIQPR